MARNHGTTEMANLMHSTAVAQDIEAHGEEPRAGDIHDVRPIPRVTIQAFC